MTAYPTARSPLLRPSLDGSDGLLHALTPAEAGWPGWSATGPQAQAAQLRWLSAFPSHGFVLAVALFIPFIVSQALGNVRRTTLIVWGTAATAVVIGWLATRVLDWGGVPHADNPSPKIRPRIAGNCRIRLASSPITREVTRCIR